MIYMGINFIAITKDPTHDLQYLKRLRYLLHRQGQYSKVNVRFQIIFFEK
jgi:hypothetical protein